ncbi:MAG TPA: hypothetical protein PKM36_02030 [Propionibacteriaceae bacterium]|nr:hypothetical protein [Propionibacteriaceae bacterium]HPZ50196.1 hypothetical protein [Propionibacteriaceae bacterium]HQE31166.1 hypothetical protein [Propionibacteriaceae bacterium]
MTSDTPDDSQARPPQAGPGSQRLEDAKHREELAKSAARGEAERAQVLIDEFIWQATTLGIPPVALRATTLGGHDVKTDKQGWYIRKNRSIAVGTDGGYYVLTVAGGLIDRLRGVKLSRTQPSLQVGRGGRDGETGDLKDFLARALHPEA